MYSTLQYDFMVQTASKCSLFTYILEQFQQILHQIRLTREKNGTKNCHENVHKIVSNSHPSDGIHQMVQWCCYSIDNALNKTN